VEDRFFIIGDIHGHFSKLAELIQKISRDLVDEDTLIFLGDYIDRGEYSYEVIEFLLTLKKRHRVIFLKGNHEAMFLDYLSGKTDGSMYLLNGGKNTVKSYRKHCGSLTVPPHHMEFFKNLKYYYEGEDFIAVHAGLHPLRKSIKEQREYDMMWIRDIFYHADNEWEKTVIFGHTPASLLKKAPGVYIDDYRNIIAMDNGIIFGNPLACIRWPDRKIYYSS